MVNNYNIDEWIFNYYEGNLSVSQQEQLMTFLKENPEFHADFDAWEASYISSEAIPYANEEKLLKKTASARAVMFSILAFIGLSLATVGIISTIDLNSSLSSNKTTEHNAFKSNKNKVERIANYTNTKNKNNKQLNLNNNLNQVNNTIPNTPLETKKQPSTFQQRKQGNFINTSTIINSKKNKTTAIAANASFLNKKEHRNLKEAQITKVEIKNRLSELFNLTYESDVKFSKRTINLTIKENELKKLKANTKENKSVIQSIKKIVDNTSEGLTVLPDRTYIKKYRNPLFVSGALAGAMGAPRIAANYINEYSTKSSYQASFDQYLQSAKIGLGIVAYHDDNFYSETAKVHLTKTGTKVIINKNLKVSKNATLTTFVAPHLYYKSINKIEGTNYNGPVGTNSHLDMDLGLVLNTERAYFGFQTQNIFESSPNILILGADQQRNDRLYQFMIGTDYKQMLSNTFSLSPQLFYTVGKEYQELNVGASGKIQQFIFGVGYSTQKNATAILGFESGLFKLEYSASVPFKNMEGFNSLTHEIGVRILLSKGIPGYLQYD